MENKIKVGIIGGAGYTGGELIRLLVNHPAVDVAAIHSKSNAGNAVSAVHGDLVGETSLFFSSDDSFLKNGSVDVLFLCVGHGDAKKFLAENEVNSKTKIIDLSQDFRLKANDTFNERQFVYGLPELNKATIIRASEEEIGLHIQF